MSLPLKTGAGRGTATGRCARAGGRVRRSDEAVERPCPGLSKPSGSNAHLTRCWWARSVSSNIVPIRSRFSTPTPCSPVRHAADLDAEPQDVGAERLGALDFAGLVGVVEDQRMQIAVAGMKHIGDAEAVLLGQTAHAAQHLRQSSARDRPIHAIVIGRNPADRRETPPCARTRTPAARHRRC